MTASSSQEGSKEYLGTSDSSSGTSQPKGRDDDSAYLNQSKGRGMATPGETEEARSVTEEPSTGKDDPNLITWAGPNDPSNPQNWPFLRKIGITAIWIYGNIVTTIASSIFSSGSAEVAKEFHESSEVVILGVSLFLLVC